VNERFPSLLRVSGMVYPLGSLYFEHWTIQTWRPFCSNQHSPTVDIERHFKTPGYFYIPHFNL